MTRTRRWTTAVLATAMVVTAAGCGSDEAGSSATDLPAVSDGPMVTDPPGTDATTIEAPSAVASTDATTAGADDYCAALDTVDLDGLLGELAGTAESESDDFGGGCTVAAADADSRGTVVLRVSTNAPTENYENAREQFGVDAEIDGLGDGAFTSGAMIVVLADDQLVNLQAVRWRDLGVDGVTDAELEAGMVEVLNALGAPAATNGTSSPDGTDGPDGAGGEETAAGLACTLLSDIDIEGLIGEPVGPATDEGDGSEDECVIEPENADSTAYASLTIFDVQAAERYTESLEIFGSDSTVDGLGDEAFHSGPVLAVRDGDRTVLLWIMGDIMLGANVDDADMEAAMAQVLAGLG